MLPHSDIITACRLVPVEFMPVLALGFSLPLLPFHVRFGSCQLGVCIFYPCKRVNDLKVTC